MVPPLPRTVRWAAIVRPGQPGMGMRKGLQWRGRPTEKNKGVVNAWTCGSIGPCVEEKRERERKWENDIILFVLFCFEIILFYFCGCGIEFVC